MVAAGARGVGEPPRGRSLRSGAASARRQALRPKLYPFFFHPNAPLRQAVVALTASYFAVESPQHLASKFPKDGAATAARDEGGCHEACGRSAYVRLRSGRIAATSASSGSHALCWQSVSVEWPDESASAIRMPQRLTEGSHTLTGRRCPSGRRASAHSCSRGEERAISRSALTRGTQVGVSLGFHPTEH